MAHEDRTEKPTPKRKKKFRKDGQVAKTPDLSGWLILLACSVIIPNLFKSADTKLTQLMGACTAVMQNPSPEGALAILEKGLGDAVALILPAVGAMAVVGVVANVAQTGLVISTHQLAPKWSKLNPAKGMKNLFSSQSLWTLLKSVLKIAVLFVIAYATLSKMAHNLVGGSTAALSPVMSYTGNNLINLLREVAAGGLVLAVGDYAWQKRRLVKQMKMTKQEVKDEFKQQEGDQHIKGAIRRKQFKMSRSRMMAAIAGADVIVMNPTHFAVAIKYDPLRGRAPVVVAKGTDHLALKIRDKGRELKVPVVEDPPLARAVYAACEIDEAVPPELFLAVARLLAFVFTLSPVLKSAGLIHRRPVTAMVA